MDQIKGPPCPVTQPWLFDSRVYHTRNSTWAEQIQCYFPKTSFQSPADCRSEISGARIIVFMFTSPQWICLIAFLNSCKLSAFRTFCMLRNQLWLFISAELTTCWFHFISLSSCIRGEKNEQNVSYFYLSITLSLSHLFSNLKNLSLYHWLWRSFRTFLILSYLSFPVIPRSLLQYSRERSRNRHSISDGFDFLYYFHHIPSILLGF